MSSTRFCSAQPFENDVQTKTCKPNRPSSHRCFYLAVLMIARFVRSSLSYQPIAKGLHAGPLQGTRRTDHVIGEASREAELERPNQPACSKVVGDQGAASKHDALAPHCSLDRVIG